jgi:Mrp family chromosome partitioning ATPase
MSSPSRRSNQRPPRQRRGQVATEPSSAAERPSANGAPAVRTTYRTSPIVQELPDGLAEPLHYLIARMQMADEAKGLPRRVGVTAAAHGDGVTTITRALAAIIASDLDARVCLIDLNPQRSPDETTGAAAAIRAGAPIERALTATADQRLFVLTSGTPDLREARAICRSSEFASALSRLEERFDYLVFDAPPVFAGSEALGVLRHTEGYLLVVRHASTTIEQVRAASEELGSLRSIGVIVNQFATRIPRRLRRFFAA